LLGHGAIGQFAIGEFNRTLSAETITIDKWYVPFTNPVRFKPGLGAVYQQVTAFHPLPIINITWFSHLSEPVRQKQGLQARYQEFQTYQNINPSVPFNWFNLLSDPVRKLPRLIESDQQFTLIDLLPTILLDWYASLSEPKRFLQGLRPDLGITLGRAEFIPTSYTARLDTTELGDFFLGVFTQFNIPLSAYVDIIQNDPRHLGNLGVIASVPTSSTIAAIIESNPVQAAGIVSPSPAAGARVAIILR
jgi:hypothetical protein